VHRIRQIASKLIKQQELIKQPGMTCCNRDPLLTKHLCDGRVSIRYAKRSTPD